MTNKKQKPTTPVTPSPEPSVIPPQAIISYVPMGPMTPDHEAARQRFWAAVLAMDAKDEKRETKETEQ